MKKTEYVPDARAAGRRERNPQPAIAWQLCRDWQAMNGYPITRRQAKVWVREFIGAAADASDKALAR